MDPMVSSNEDYFNLKKVFSTNQNTESITVNTKLENWWDYNAINLYLLHLLFCYKISTDEIAVLKEIRIAPFLCLDLNTYK